MQVNPNLTFLRDNGSDTRILVCQGGTRSGKTYSILQYLIEIAYKYRNHGLIISIAREAMPALRGTTMRDFFEILNSFNAYSERYHNKKDNIYKLYGNYFEFFSLQEEQKVKGRKRDILYLNEANECNKKIYMQLMFRTRGFAIMDYNPSFDQFHWIPESVLSRKDCKKIITTFNDNPFISDEQRKEIERLRDADQNYWRIYGMGISGISTEHVYNHWKVAPVDLKYEDWDYVYGLDFGYNVPSALVQVFKKENKIVWRQKLYQSSLTNQDIIERLKVLEISRKKELWCDAAEPDRIEEIYKAGFNAKSANKDVTLGIDKVKSYEFYIDPESIDIIKELKAYKWKVDKKGNKIDEPIGLDDHSLDAGRYGTFNFNKTILKPAKFNF